MSHDLIKMPEFVRIIQERTTIEPKSIVEIGALDASDAVYVWSRFIMPPSAVTVFEPVPRHYEKIKNAFPAITAYPYAVGDKKQKVTLNAIHPSENNQAISSVLPKKHKRTYEKIEVQQVRADQYLTECDVVKIDVEGLTFEVLVGFGNLLKDVNVFHLECEHKEVWEGQKLYCDVEKLLVHAGFMCLAMKFRWPQSDSVWTQPKYLK